MAASYFKKFVHALLMNNYGLFDIFLKVVQEYSTFYNEIYLILNN